MIYKIENKTDLPDYVIMQVTSDQLQREYVHRLDKPLFFNNLCVINGINYMWLKSTDTNFIDITFCLYEECLNATRI